MHMPCSFERPAVAPTCQFLIIVPKFLYCSKFGFAGVLNLRDLWGFVSENKIELDNTKYVIQKADACCPSPLEKIV